MVDIKNIVAYYSLPRLERINASMHWESGILLQNERWLAPKIFLTYKFLIPIFLKYELPLFLNTWVSNYEHSSAAWGWKKRATPFINITKRVLLKKKYQKTKILNHYIYHYNNRYITLVLYMKNKIYDTFKWQYL